MQALNWISNKIGVDIVDTTPDEYQDSNSHNPPLSSAYTMHPNIFEEGGAGPLSSSVHHFADDISPSSRYMESDAPGIFSSAASPFIARSVVPTPSSSPRKDRGEPLLDGGGTRQDGMATASGHYGHLFQGGGKVGGMTSLDHDIHHSHGFNGFGQQEEMMGVPDPSTSESKELSSAHQVIGQLVKVDPAVIQAKAQEAKEKVTEFSHVTQERVMGYVSKASSWMEGFQGVVKKKVYQEWWKDDTGRGYEFTRCTNEGLGVNNEVDENGLPVSKNWYEFNAQLGRWDVTPDAPPEVRQDFYEQLQAEEEAKRRRALAAAGGEDGTAGVMLVPPPPPPSSSWQNGEGRGDSGGATGARRVASMRAPLYAVPSYFSSDSGTSPLAPPTASPSEARPFPPHSSTARSGVSQDSQAGQPSKASVSFPFPPSPSTSSFLTTLAASTGMVDGGSGVLPTAPQSFGAHLDPTRAAECAMSHTTTTTTTPAMAMGGEVGHAYPTPFSSTAVGGLPPPSTAPPRSATVSVLNIDPIAAAAASIRCHPNPLQSLSRKGAASSQRSQRVGGRTPVTPTAVSTPSTELPTPALPPPSLSLSPMRTPPAGEESHPTAEPFSLVAPPPLHYTSSSTSTAPPASLSITAAAAPSAMVWTTNMSIPPVPPSPWNSSTMTRTTNQDGPHHSSTSLPTPSTMWQDTPPRTNKEPMERVESTYRTEVPHTDLTANRATLDPVEEDIKRRDVPPTSLDPRHLPLPQGSPFSSSPPHSQHTTVTTTTGQTPLFVSGATTLTPLSVTLGQSSSHDSGSNTEGKTSGEGSTSALGGARSSTPTASSTSWPVLPPPMPSASHPHTIVLAIPSISARGARGGGGEGSVAENGTMESSRDTQKNASAVCSGHTDSTSSQLSKSIPPPPPPPSFTPFIPEG